MYSDSNGYVYKGIVVGEKMAGKTALVTRLSYGYYEFPSSYVPTIGVEFAVLRKESIKLQIWDLAGDERFRGITKSYYRGNEFVIYVLDSTKEVEENKRIFQAFNQEVISRISTQDHLRLIVFTKSDDFNSKLSQDYINEFDVFNVSTLICSAKDNKGVNEIADKLFNYAKLVFVKKDESAKLIDESAKLILEKKNKEDFLVSEIERYSKKLSKKNSQMAKNKATALEAIAKACRDRGMGQHGVQTSLSIAKIAGIKRIIKEEKEITRQHRHWSVFNCFFNLVSLPVLERRITSHRLVSDLDDYLNTESLSVS